VTVGLEVLDHRIGARQTESAAASEDHRMRLVGKMVSKDQGVELPSPRRAATNVCGSGSALRTEDDRDTGLTADVGAMADGKAADRQLAVERREARQGGHIADSSVDRDEIRHCSSLELELPPWSTPCVGLVRHSLEACAFESLT